MPALLQRRIGQWRDASPSRDRPTVTPALEAVRATEDFERAISQHPVAIVDFFAQWCGPCHALAPILEAVAADHAAQGVYAAKVDIDKHPGLAERFQIMGVPTVIVFHRAQELHRFVGVMPHARYEGALQEALSRERG